MKHILAVIALTLCLITTLHAEDTPPASSPVTPADKTVPEEVYSTPFSKPSPGQQPAKNEYDRRRAKGLRNADFYSYYLINKAHNNPSQVMAYLKEALKYSPDLPAVYFYLAWVSFSKSPTAIYDTIHYLIEGFRAYKRNFWWSFNLAGVFTIGLLLAFVFTIVVVVLVRLSVDLPLMTHEIKEENRNIFILVLVFFISAMGPLYFFASVLMLLSLYFKKTDLIVTYVFLGALILLPLFLKPVQILLSAEMSSALKAVVAVNEGEDNNYAINVLSHSKERDEVFSYALALKREGRLAEAVSSYKKLIENDPDDAIVYNNLGNCYAIMGQNNKAIAMFKKAAGLKPLVSAYYNLSQISREQLNFSEGDKYFDKAKAIDPDAITGYREVSSREPNSFYIDETLKQSDFWRLAGHTSGDYIIQVTLLPLWLTPVVGLMITITFIGLLRVKRNKAYSCKRCGTIMCPKCGRRLSWGDMCYDCFTSLITFEKDPRDRISRLFVVQESKRKRKNILTALSLFMPGAHLIYAGRIMKGAALTFLFLMPASIFITSFLYRISIYPFIHSWLIFTVITVTIVFYIVNIFTTRRSIKKWL